MPAAVPAAVSPDVAALLGQAEATCQLWAEQDEGPYRADVHPTRRDVTEDRDGVRLALGLVLGDERGTPTAGGTVEIWHCDAAGRYSGFPPPAGAPHTEYVRGQTFLRGSQPTDSAGRVEFRTIYPGWYPGRTVHIHVIVRAGGETFTSQLYFPEEATAAVFASPPYSERPGRDTTNATDTIFPTGGEPAVLHVVPATGGGYLAAIGLHLPAARL
jgi:protocatechuate 3,4-dioxygenase beta subunit